MKLRALVLALAVGGCVGPDFTPPPAPEAKTYTAEPLPEATVAAHVQGGGMQRFVAERDIPGLWWTLFRSPGLNALVERALRNNADLKAAQAALRVADETAQAQAGGFWPTITGNAGATRQKTLASVGANSSAGGHNSVYNLDTSQLGISYAACRGRWRVPRPWPRPAASRWKPPP